MFVVSLFTHQIGKDEDKESILTTLCDTIIKDRDGDREMMKDIISETELSNLNINLKVICLVCMVFVLLFTKYRG